MAVQLLDSLRVADLSSTPPAVSLTSTDLGRLPSRSPSSSQALVTVTEVFSGAYLFVIAKPSVVVE